MAVQQMPPVAPEVSVVQSNSVRRRSSSGAPFKLGTVGKAAVLPQRRVTARQICWAVTESRMVARAMLQEPDPAFHYPTTESPTESQERQAQVAIVLQNPVPVALPAEVPARRRPGAGPTVRVPDRLPPRPGVRTWLPREGRAGARVPHNRAHLRRLLKFGFGGGGSCLQRGVSTDPVFHPLARSAYCEAI